MFNIFIKNSSSEEKRGQADSRDNLVKLLTNKEVKSIFEHEAWDSIQDVFNTAKIIPNLNSYIADANGIIIDCISDGYKISTMVFYL